MNTQILDFILENEILSLSMLEQNAGLSEIYTASAFYAFDTQNLAFLIASHENTKHINLAFLNPFISVNIAPKPSSLLSLKGLQAKAKFTLANKEQEKIYYNKFAYAKLSSANIYALNLYWGKFTNNALSKKLEFKREI